VETAAADGVEQLRDPWRGPRSFAYRRPDLLGQVRVFEVDHPASQAWKRQRLEEMHIRPPDNLTYAPIDFREPDLPRVSRRRDSISRLARCSRGSA